MNGEKVMGMIKDEFVMMFDKMPTATAQQKGINHRTGTVYTKTKVQDVKDMFLERLKEHAPEHPIEGAVAITIHFQFDIKDKKKWNTWKTTRPDTDNMEKLLLDCMTKAGFWLDDSQVVSKWTLKQYSSSGSAAIVINYREECD